MLLSAIDIGWRKYGGGGVYSGYKGNMVAFLQLQHRSQLQLRSDPWSRNSICHRAAQKKKRRRKKKKKREQIL